MRTASPAPALGVGTLIGLLLGAVAVGTLAAAAPFLSPPGERPATLTVLVQEAVGLSFLFVGVAAWSRRPDNRVGALMTAVGVAWFVPYVFWVNTPLMFTVAQLTEFLWWAVLAHLFVAFPSGRLQSVRERVLVGAVYAWWAVKATLSMALWDPRRTACPGCPLNLYLVRRGDAVQLVNLGAHVRDEFRLIDWGTIAIALVVLAVVLDRWRRASRPRRRALAPVTLSAVPSLLLLVALDVTPSLENLPYPVAPYLWVAAPIVLVALPVLFLGGLLRVRLAQSAVGTLVAELAGPLPPGALRDALARTLRDPSVEIAFWLPDRSAFVDAEGAPVDLPHEKSGRAVTMLDSADGDLVGALVHDSSLDDQPGLLRAVGGAARLAIENERLQADLRAQLDEVRGSRQRMVEVGFEVRRRIERDLHDGAQQRFVAALIDLRLAIRQLPQDAPAVLRESLDGAAVELKRAIDELREFVHGIYPPILTEEGLAPALASLAERSPVPVTVSAPADRWAPEVEATAYFVASEALTNVAKYAQASFATVHVEHIDSRLLVEVLDDGVGGADGSRGSGLRGLEARVEALDGRLMVQSERGGGTRVLAEIPVASVREDP